MDFSSIFFNYFKGMSAFFFKIKATHYFVLLLQNCKQPEQAFSYFLPKVLNWLKDLGENRRKIRILWKNISPSPVVSLGTCGGPTNSEILWANQITRFGEPNFVLFSFIEKY